MLILHLLRIYGKITRKKLKSKYDAIKQVPYNIEEPIGDIFPAIKYLLEIRELLGGPYYSQQNFDLGYLIISKHRFFRSDARKWMRRPHVDQTWKIFKQDFTDAHYELYNTGTTVNKLGFHRANATVS